MLRGLQGGVREAIVGVHPATVRGEGGVEEVSMAGGL